MAPTTRKAAVKNSSSGVEPKHEPNPRSASASSWGSSLTSLTDSTTARSPRSMKKKKRVDDADRRRGGSPEEDQLEDSQSEEDEDEDEDEEEVKRGKTTQNRRGRPKANAANASANSGNAASTSRQPQEVQTKGRSRNALAQARHRAKRKEYIKQLEETVYTLQVAFNSRAAREPAFAHAFQGQGQGHSDASPDFHTPNDAEVQHRMELLERENEELMRAVEELRRAVAVTQAHAQAHAQVGKREGVVVRKLDVPLSLGREQQEVWNGNVGSRKEYFANSGPESGLDSELRLPSDALLDVDREREQKRRKVSLADSNDYLTPLVSPIHPHPHPHGHGEEFPPYTPHYQSYTSPDTLGSTNGNNNNIDPALQHPGYCDTRNSHSLSVDSHGGQTTYDNSASGKANYKISRPDNDVFLDPILPPPLMPFPWERVEYMRGGVNTNALPAPHASGGDGGGGNTMTQPLFRGLSLTPFSKSGGGDASEGAWDDVPQHLRRRASSAVAAAATLSMPPPPDTIQPFSISRPPSSLSVHSVHSVHSVPSSFPSPSEQSPNTMHPGHFPHSHSHQHPHPHHAPVPVPVPVPTQAYMSPQLVYDNPPSPPPPPQSTDWNTPVKVEPAD